MVNQTDLELISNNLDFIWNENNKEFMGNQNDW